MVTERVTIEANALAIANVRLAHRDDIRGGRALLGKLMCELNDITDRPDLVEALIMATSQLADDPARREQSIRTAFERVTSLPARVTSLKQLVESMRVVVSMEREAWGVTEIDPQSAGSEMPPHELGDVLKQVVALRLTNSSTNSVFAQVRQTPKRRKLLCA